MKASLGDDVDLHGWVTAGVVDLASVNLGDRHYGVSLGRGRILALRPLQLHYGGGEGDGLTFMILRELGDLRKKSSVS